MKKDKIILKEKDDTLQITITMSSIMPCIKSIKHYEPHFKAQDITKGKYFTGTMLENIADYFNDYLYQVIDNNSKQRQKEIRKEVQIEWTQSKSNQITVITE